MNLKKVVVLSILILGICFIPGVYANDNADFSAKRREKMEKNTETIYNQLNLSESQKKQLDENKLHSREKRKTLYEKMRSYKQALNQEIMKPQLDMAKIDEIQRSIKTLQAQMVDDRLESILAVRKILTAEQFTQFITQVEKSRQEFRGKEEKE